VVDKQFGRGKTVVADDGQEASTFAYVVKTMMHPILGDISLCEVTIQTGRMHQIRVHLAHAGHHIV
jgi:23S rRNA-/tRNA-specific pseudouridylate synthase